MSEKHHSRTGPEKAEAHAHPPPAGRRAISPTVIERAAALFRAAGEPARLHLLDRLRDGEQCVSALAEDVGDDLSAVSQRLRILRTEGLVVRRREGKHVYYALTDDHIADLIQNTIAHAEEQSSANHNSTPNGRHRR